MPQESFFPFVLGISSLISSLEGVSKIPVKIIPIKAFLLELHTVCYVKLVAHYQKDVGKKQSMMGSVTVFVLLVFVLICTCFLCVIISCKNASHYRVLSVKLFASCFNLVGGFFNL